MSKTKTSFFCQHCGHESIKWVGQCPSCGQWNSFVEEIKFIFCEHRDVFICACLASFIGVLNDVVTSFLHHPWEAQGFTCKCAMGVCVCCLGMKNTYKMETHVVTTKLSLYYRIFRCCWYFFWCDVKRKRIWIPI